MRRPKFWRDFFWHGPEVSSVNPIVISRQVSHVAGFKEIMMIKPLNAPQLSAVKSRTGLQSISELLPRLIRQYELQAELMKRRANLAQSPVIGIQTGTQTQQSTFAWYE
jgi:hypothetical protein